MSNKMTVTETITCTKCKQSTEFEMTAEQYTELNNPTGKHIQHIFPELTPDEREIMISGICSDCFDKMFNI